MSTMAPRPIHDLKTWPDAFDAVLEEVKQYEVRKFDRDFQVGDYVRLLEFVPDGFTGYTGRHIMAVITYITPPGQWGLPSDVGVLGISPVHMYSP